MYFTRRLVLLGYTINNVIAQSPESQVPILPETQSDDCHNVCTALQTSIPETYYGSLPPDFSASYFNHFQRTTIPACVIRPTSPLEVSTAIQIIRSHSCHFAVRSGGHVHHAGASNADGGVTIDLARLKGVVISEDEKVTSVGPGNRWGEVYEVLEPKGLMVVGGRDRPVGVGGLLLGGGISWISGKYGFACDNVVNFEIVLANGTITNANLDTNPDLYWALRGGGNNFGIVTRFDLITYPHDPLSIWGGHLFYLFSDISTLRAKFGIETKSDLSLFSLTRFLGRTANKLACSLGYCTNTAVLHAAVEKILQEEENDPHYAMYQSYGYLPSLDLVMAATCLVHTGAQSNAPIFKEIMAEKAVYSTLRNSSMLDMSQELMDLDKPGYRLIWATITIKPSLVLHDKIFGIFLKQIETTKHAKGVLPTWVVQPFGSGVVALAETKNGGNPMGLSADDGPLVCYSMQIRWDSDADTDIVRRSGRAMIDEAVEAAKEMGLFHRFVYANYADSWQDVYGGYGEENREKLKEIQKRYDPEGMLVRLQPGYFKL